MMGKLLYDERAGYSYESDNGVMYSLLEGRCLKGSATSDIIFIMLSYNEKLYEEIYDICGDKEYVGYLWGATDPKIDVIHIEDICKQFEKKYPDIVNWFKKKKRITKPMPTELKEMLKNLEHISQCGRIRTYYDKEGREMAEGGLDEYEYSDSTLVHNLMCCCEEVAYALLNEDVDEAERTIKIYAKELAEEE